jgi:poly(3-hydroxybutyrate) depolymerase
VSRPYCLNIEDNIYKLGDLNLMLQNKETMTYPPMDPQDPKKPFFTGVIPQEVKVNGEVRRFLLYIPEHYPISGAGFFLYPDDGVRCEDFLAQEPWKAVAENQNAALIILESRPTGWDRVDIQSEIDYSEAVFKKAISRVYFSMNESTYYIMGLGGGAYVATAHGLLSSSLFSCVLADGDYRLHPQLLRQLREIRSDRDVTCSKLDVAMPAWLVQREAFEEDLVLENLLRANQCEDRDLRCGETAVYQQDTRRWHAGLDALPICEVRRTGATAAEHMDPAELHRQMMVYALRFKRWLAIGNGCFRSARTYQDMGLKRFEAKVDGLKREWYVYEPTAHRKDAETKLPLLLAIHGYSCTGELFAENAEWHVVGERRDFFVVYVSAYPSNLSFGGKTVPLPTWNAVGMRAATDDLHYIQEVLRSVKAQYPIDPERVYVSGHSNGSLFTQTLMKEMPLEFAAFAPQGAQMHMTINHSDDLDQRTILPDGVIRPVWLMMGSEDIGDQDRIAPGNANDRFLEMMCAVNGLDRNQADYLENGKYHTYTFRDAQGVPLLRFSGIDDTPHCYTQEFAQIYWDQFLCHFRRKADGTIVYTL